MISQVKLIAEPWDVGEGGYQVGKFPPLWAEWNGRYRDVVRRYWKGDDGQLAELGYRLTGSSDLYQRDGRHPTASINFVTAHDGFTLHDLVSYNDKAQRGQRRRQPRRVQRQSLLQLRRRKGRRKTRKFSKCGSARSGISWLTLLLSQGVPMICGGDEIGRTQQGNNNAYAQDNEISWYDWDLDDRAQVAARIHPPAGGDRGVSIPTCTAGSSSRTAASTRATNSSARWTATASRTSRGCARTAKK